MTKRRKAPRLKAADALDRLDEMIALIDRDVEIALQTEAALQSANEIVHADGLKGVQFYGADCFNTVQLSTSLFLALTLAKLFEIPSLRGKSKSERFDESDVASIPLMIRLLRQTRCRTRLCDRARKWKPTSAPELHAKSCERAIDRAIGAYALLHTCNRAAPDESQQTLEHNPSSWNQLGGLCPVKHRAPVRAFPVKLNCKRFNLTGKRSSKAAFGGDAEPAGYTQASIATIRLWRARSDR